MNFVQDGSARLYHGTSATIIPMKISSRHCRQVAVTIKVGSHVSAASFYTGNYIDVRNFLRELTTYNSMAKDQAVSN